MTSYTPVCSLAELVDCQPRAVQVDGAPVMVVRIADEVFAMSDVCSHAEIPLSEGVVEPEGTVSCWLHGSRFDLRTGEPEDPPAWEPVDVYGTAVIEEDGIQKVAVSLSPPREGTP